MELREIIEKANHEAFERMNNAQAYWVDVGLAIDRIPGMRDEMLLHAGPPVSWENASGPLRGALIGAVIYEGWASTPREAENLLRRGDIVFEPTHHHSAVAPMAGVISPTMPVMVFHDPVHDNYSYTNLNEGLGRVLRYGAYGEEVIERLKMMRDKLYPALQALVEAIRNTGTRGLDYKSIMAQALHMGDECHNRNYASNLLFLKEITPHLIELDLGASEKKTLTEFIANNPTFTLNMNMAAAKLMAQAAHGIEYSTVVSVISRNGTEVGIWVSGIGDEWITAPAPIARGVFFPGYSEKDASGDIGDSAIMETIGLGGFAMAAAPAIINYVGGTIDYIIDTVHRMYEITVGENKAFTIPYLGFRGTPTAIDIRKVLKTGISPVINTGIAHREPGIGQIGAGIVELPFELFKKAIRRYAEKYGL